MAGTGKFNQLFMQREVVQRQQECKPLSSCFDASKIGSRDALLLPENVPQVYFVTEYRQAAASDEALIGSVFKSY